MNSNFQKERVGSLRAAHRSYFSIIEEVGEYVIPFLFSVFGYREKKVKNMIP